MLVPGSPNKIQFTMTITGNYYGGIGFGATNAMQTGFVILCYFTTVGGCTHWTSTNYQLVSNPSAASSLSLVSANLTGNTRVIVFTQSTVVDGATVIPTTSARTIFAYGQSGY